MLIEIIYLSLIYSISLFYNTYITPVIFSVISYNTYNNVIIFIMLLVQIDNFILYMDYKNKEVEFIKDINMENFNIIKNHLKILISKNKKNKKLIKYNSYNDLNDLKNND